MIVFRPFKGETLFGRISSADQDGIHSKTNMPFANFLAIVGINY